MTESRALYLKWRPTNFTDVVGQMSVVDTIRNAVIASKTVHAYLFSGPRGTGKTTVARILAKALNCMASDLSMRPCNKCDHCLSVNSGMFLDLIEIDAASNNSVEDIRDLRDKINYAPGQGIYKVYIVDEVHMLSGAAFNALLKTLEEPPPHAVFVLATTELHKVPATVKSRCQCHTFGRISVTDIVERLQTIASQEKATIDNDALYALARYSTGSLRDAVSLLDQVMMDSEITISLDSIQNILGTTDDSMVADIVGAIANVNVSSGIEIINDAVEGGADPNQLAKQIVSFLRGVLMCGTGNANLVDASSQTLSLIQQCEKSMNTRQIVSSVQEFDRAARDNTIGWQPQLALEIAFVNSVQNISDNRDVKNNESLTLSNDKGNANDADSSVVGDAHNDKGNANDADSSVVSDAHNDKPNLKNNGLTVAEINTLWKEIISCSRASHHTLPALLEWCIPVRVENDVVQIAVKEEFAIAKLDKPEMIIHLQNTITETSGYSLAVQFILMEGSGNLDASIDVSDDGVVAMGVELGAKVRERTSRRK